MSFCFARSFLFLVLPLLPLLAADTVSDISQQVKRVLPSVVKVKIQRSETTDDENDLISLDGGGSGFVFDADHHIVTNVHVIKDAKKIIVIDHNHTEHPATLVGKDDKTDIAVLNVPSFDALPLNFKHSNELSIGQGVFAIGSPFSLGHSVSAGIISSLGRFLPNYPYIRFIQTDASINPGNSGGALFDRDGNVIAMASTYYSKQGNYTNIGFAIPSEDIERVGEILIRDKTVSRGYLGAELIYSQNISRKLGYTNAIYIARVIPNSPAEKAGLKTGDLIIKNDRQTFYSGGELYRKLEQSKPGDLLLLSIRRNQSTSEYEIVLDTAPESSIRVTNAGSADVSEKSGLVLVEKNGSVYISTSFAGADNVGLETNDVVVALNTTIIKSIKEINNQLSKLKENELLLMTILRNKEQLIVPFGQKTALKVTNTTN